MFVNFYCAWERYQNDDNIDYVNNALLGATFLTICEIAIYLQVKSRAHLFLQIK